MQVLAMATKGKNDIHDVAAKVNKLAADMIAPSARQVPPLLWPSCWRRVHVDDATGLEGRHDPRGQHVPW